MLGTLGRDALAAGGLGANLFFTLMIVVAGGLISVSILVAHARGADEGHRIGPILRGGFLLALLAAVPPMLLLWNEHPLLLLIGEPPALADAIAGYDRVLLFAMPASLIMATQRNFLAAMEMCIRDRRHTVLDWMEALALPVLLVAGSYLGTISHTLSAVDVLTRRGLKIAALVVSETEGSTVGMGATIATLRRFVPAAVEILALPRLDGQDHPVIDRLAEMIAKP